MHSWTVTHFNRLLGEFQASIEREPPVPKNAPLDFVPSEAQQTYTAARTSLTRISALIACRALGG